MMDKGREDQLRAGGYAAGYAAAREQAAKERERWCREIIEKCEQYWNESGQPLSWPEVHAILVFIHVRAAALRQPEDQP